MSCITWASKNNRHVHGALTRCSNCAIGVCGPSPVVVGFKAFMKYPACSSVGPSIIWRNAHGTWLRPCEKPALSFRRCLVLMKALFTLVGTLKSYGKATRHVVNAHSLAVHVPLVPCRRRRRLHHSWCRDGQWAFHPRRRLGRAFGNQMATRTHLASFLQRSI